MIAVEMSKESDRQHKKFYTHSLILTYRYNGRGGGGGGIGKISILKSVINVMFRKIA